MLLRPGGLPRGEIERVLGRPLTETPGAPDPALGQVERAISATLEHHAHLRLMPTAGRSG